MVAQFSFNDNSLPLAWIQLLILPSMVLILLNKKQECYTHVSSKCVLTGMCTCKTFLRTDMDVNIIRYR